MQKTKPNTLAILSWLVWITCIVLLTPSASADEGYGPEETPVTHGQLLPRFTATSETFELVGTVNGKNLTLYLDHYADGSPVKDAQLELELDGVKVSTTPHGEGEFEATLAQELKPGITVVQATVIAGETADLLVGEFDLHHDTMVASQQQEASPAWKTYALWSGASISILLLALFVATRFRTSRKSRSGGTV